MFTLRVICRRYRGWVFTILMVILTFQTAAAKSKKSAIPGSGAFPAGPAKEADVPDFNPPPEVPTPTSKAPIRAISLEPETCTCGTKHGKVIINRTDGTKQTMMEKMAADPQLSPDKTAAGWLHGSHEKSQDSNKAYAGKDLIILTPTGSTNVFHPEKWADVHWKFYGSADRVIIASRGTHGPTTLQLEDAKNGRELGHAMNFDQNLPDWAKEAAKLGGDE